MNCKQCNGVLILTYSMGSVKRLKCHSCGDMSFVKTRKFDSFNRRRKIHRAVRVMFRGKTDDDRWREKNGHRAEVKRLVNNSWDDPPMSEADATEIAKRNRSV